MAEQKQTSRAADWFYGLPIWQEIDNFIYFGFAFALLYLVGVEHTKELLGAVVGALIIKAKGKESIQA